MSIFGLQSVIKKYFFNIIYYLKTHKPAVILFVFVMKLFAEVLFWKNDSDHVDSILCAALKKPPQSEAYLLHVQTHGLNTHIIVSFSPLRFKTEECLLRQRGVHEESSCVWLFVPVCTLHAFIVRPSQKLSSFV